MDHAMDAIPPYISGRKVDPTGRYKCPLCRVQGTGDPEDTGWVSCPMLQNQMICLGSCIEYQKVARSEEFSTHFDKEHFEELSSRTRQSVSELRRTCMRHQLQIVGEQMSDQTSDRDRLRALKATVLKVLTHLDALS